MSSKKIAKKLPKSQKHNFTTAINRLSRPLSYLKKHTKKHAIHTVKSPRPAHFTVFSIFVVIGVVVGANIFQSAYALNSWIQTNWNGGVGSSTSTQYASGTNVDTSTSGEAKLSTTSGWCSNASCNSSWKYRRQVTFDNRTSNLGVTSENLTSFPVLIKLDSSRIDYANTQNSGQDLRFTDTDGTDLAYEIEKWDESGTSYVWVKVPQVDSNSNADYVQMYYGNASASDHQQASSVWSSGYGAVWHMKETSGTTAADSTGNNNGTKTGATDPNPVTTGQIDGAQDFSGDSVSVPSSASLNLTTQITMSGWVTADSMTTWNSVLMKSSSSSWADGYGIYFNGTLCGFVTSYSVNKVCNAFPPTATPRYLVVTYDGANMKMYLDGAQVATAAMSVAISTNSAALGIGTGAGGAYNWDGIIDELRISSTARSAAYVAASYKGDKDLYASYGSQQSVYQTSGSLTSNIFDTGVGSAWGDLAYNASTPTGTTATVKVRAGNSADLSDATAFSSCSAVSSSSDLTGGCSPDNKRYVQYQVSLTSDGTVTPTFQDNSITYSAFDGVAPTTNASTIAMKRTAGGADISSNGWTNGASPYFSWTAGADDGGGSGIKGYCLYLGQDSTGNPVTTKGLLGTSPVDTGGACQFAVSATSVDLATSGYLGTALSTSDSPYYINIKAIDNGNNVYSGSSAAFHFRFDNTPPTNPSFITAPSQFVANKAVTLTWPTAGGDSASDANAGLSGLQYRVGSSGIWYGDTHNSSEDASDLLSNDGSYTMQSSPDFASLNEGNNIVYFRTWDAAGNYSPAYVTTVIKLNTTSPSGPQNVTATPSTNTTNSFAFSWLAPATYTGSASNITYCYTINALPNGSNCTYTVAGVTSLSAGAYATQPGENTFYVVAKDEANNINYATVSSATFTANTAAPGVPLNLDIADISTKTTSNWKLALSWEEPTQTGAGVASYKILRSTDNSSFSQVASTSGTSHVDSGLTQQTYYYKVKACDSANNCGALTNVVSKFPTGKFTSAATLLSAPKISGISTKKATISWVTDRGSDSKVAIGTKSGSYSSDEIANSDQVTNHTINLQNLSPGTTYYFVSKWTDEDGNTGTSPQGSFTTLPAPSISNVNTSGINISNATITFTSVSADSVKIYYGKSKDFGATRVLNTSNSESTYSTQLTGLDDGTTYYYRINPFDADGNEYTQTIFTFTTPSRPRITNLRFQPVPDQPTSTQQVTWSTNVPSTSELAYGPNGQAQQNAADPRLTTDHSLTIDALNDNTEYSLTAQSRDSAGNLAVSDKQIFHTALDTRPPKISGLKVTSSIKGTGTDAAGQIIVAWKTDEPATSQVAYGEGSDNSNFNTSTAEDRALVTDHAVVVSNLSTSQIFHLKALSKDVANNQAHSDSRTTIIGNATDSVISIIFNALQKVFGGF